MNFKNEFKNKEILLLGGSGYIGKRLAKNYLEFGANVTVIDLIKPIGLEGKVDFYSIDLSEIKKTKTIFEKVNSIKNYHILINLAALTKSFSEKNNLNYFREFEDYELELWSLAQDVNLTSYMLSCQIFGSTMKKNKNGIILNFASDVGIIAPNDKIYEGQKFNTPVPYSVSKSSVIHLSKVLATRWAQYGIRVNSISPSGIERDQNKVFKKQLKELFPINRMMKVDEIVGPTLFLTSSMSSFIIGHNLVVDGGRTVW